MDWLESSRVERTVAYGVDCGSIEFPDRVLRIGGWCQDTL